METVLFFEMFGNYLVVSCRRLEHASDMFSSQLSLAGCSQLFGLCGINAANSIMLRQSLLVIRTDWLLLGLCQRRHWPEPQFVCFRSRNGYTCTARVNNREYTTDTEYESDELAREGAAMQAYMICRNFSVNDGMYPGQRQGQGGVVQGLPVAIGTGRRSTTTSIGDYDSGSSNYAEASSGDSSPRTSDSGFDTASRRSSRASLRACYCGRGNVRAYERCNNCLRECGWR